MKITCPTCNAVYNIPSAKVPAGRSASATCKQCGGKITIVTKTEVVAPEDFKFHTGNTGEFKGAEASLGAIAKTGLQSKKMSVPLLILFTFITFGIYIPVWFLQRRKAFNHLNSEKKLGAGVFIFAIVALGFNLFVSFTLGFIEGFTGEAGLIQQVEPILDLISAIANITLLVKSFKVRRIFKDHFKEPFSAVATFFFQAWYLQYKINRLPSG